MKKVIVITVAFLLVLSGVAVSALYYIGDKMVNTLVDSELNALLEEQPASSLETSGASVAVPKATRLSEPSKTTSMNAGNQNEATEATANETITAKTGDKTAKTEAAKAGDKTAKTEAAKAGDKTAKTEAAKAAENVEAPVKNPTDQKRAVAEPDKPKSEEKIQYTVEELNQVKEKVTSIDKINAAALLVRRLTAADMEELKSMLPDGVSAVEKKRAKEIMCQRFTAEEIEIIREMYLKYMDE